jgi:DDE superfamily endonuclease/Helix-turn-helix of DDE superfamily endonuclease
MIFRREHLGQHPAVSRRMTGLSPQAFDEMLPGLPQAFHADRRRRLGGKDRRRAIGGGDTFDLGPADQFLLTVVWLRHYPTQECLGYLFGVSDSTALRAARRCLPILERAGKGTMRLPDPGRFNRRPLPRLLEETPALAVIVDTFEQRAQRPKRRQRAYYWGKKKAHTLKSQVAVDEDGHVVDVGVSRPGPTADLKVFRRSGLAGRLARAGVGALGDLA